MRTTYDVLPYPGNPFFQTHPDRLATIGTLFGMTPAPVGECRVLELACGDGGNLIPMAFSLPGSQFVGIDLAASAIGKGESLVSAIGLTNITLRHMNVMEVGPEFGEFDYVIAHGLFSWVPEEVQAKILAICQLNLAPRGIAFVSYNAYPGGHLRDTLREMMRFHVRNTAETGERIKQARELLEFLLIAHTADDAYGVSMRAEIKSFLDRKPQHLYHDELTEINTRLYFHDFIARASKHHLQYLGEARLANIQSGMYPPAVAKKLAQYSGDDVLQKEQYLDFVKIRKFRQTLLCHQAVSLDRQPTPDRVMNLSAASQAQASSSEPDVRSSATEKFEFPEACHITMNHPLGKAALLHLGHVWPDSVPLPELVRIARAACGRDSSGELFDDDSHLLCNMILKLYASDLLELYTHPPKLVRTVSERPVASLLARAQAQQGRSVTNLRHGNVDIEDEKTRQLLLLLDGTRDRTELLAKVRELANAPEVTSDQLDTNLQHCAKLALLVA